MAGHQQNSGQIGVHVAASADLRDDAWAGDQGFAGKAVKQRAPSVDTPRADLNLIVAGEQYYLITKGENSGPIPGGLNPAKGDLLYIDPADNALYKVAAAGRLVLGKVVYVTPERGLPAATMSVDLDNKAPVA